MEIRSLFSTDNLFLIPAAPVHEYLYSQVRLRKSHRLTQDRRRLHITSRRITVACGTPTPEGKRWVTMATVCILPLCLPWRPDKADRQAHPAQLDLVAIAQAILPAR
jgi:hypothetical protein